MKTLISTSLYPNDSEVRSLLHDSGWQYKWGGELGTTTYLTYSFASQNTFGLDQAYRDSLNYYTTILDDYDETLFDDPQYAFIPFSENIKSSVRVSLDTWSDVTGINFIEVQETGDGNNYGDIRLFIQDFSKWSSIDSIFDNAGGCRWQRW